MTARPIPRGFSYFCSEEMGQRSQRYATPTATSEVAE